MCVLVEIPWGSLALVLLDRVSDTSFSSQNAARIVRCFHAFVLGAAWIWKRVGEGRFDGPGDGHLRNLRVRIEKTLGT